MIAYLSHDEVNAAIVRRIADRFGLDLQLLGHKDADASVDAERLVVDLDHLPAEYRAKLFSRIGTGDLRDGIAVHSYHLTSGEVGVLRKAGVRVARRLTAVLFTPAIDVRS